MMGEVMLLGQPQLMALALTVRWRSVGALASALQPLHGWSRMLPRALELLPQLH